MKEPLSNAGYVTIHLMIATTVSSMRTAMSSNLGIFVSLSVTKNQVQYAIKDIALKVV